MTFLPIPESDLVTFVEGEGEPFSRVKPSSLATKVMKCLPDAIFNYGASSNQLRVLANRLCGGGEEREASFDPEDPVPFLVLNHLQLPWLLLGTMLRGTPWKKLDFAIGKVVELNGD